MGFIERILKNKIDGKDAQEWFNLGAREHDPVKKIECFGNVVKLKPNFVGALNLLGNAHKELGEYDKALEYYNEALDIRPSYREALYNKENLEKEMKEKGSSN